MGFLNSPRIRYTWNYLKSVERKISLHAQFSAINKPSQSRMYLNTKQEALGEELFTEPHGSRHHESMYLTLPKDVQNSLCPGSRMQLPALVSKVAFSFTDRSKKVRDPKLHVEGTECLQASRCTLLLPEVSRGERPHSFGSFPLWSSFLFFLPPSY